MSESNIFGQAPEKKEKVQRFNESNVTPEVVMFNPAQIAVGNRANSLTQQFAVNLYNQLVKLEVGHGSPIPSTGTDGSDRAAAKDIANRVNELCEANERNFRATHFKISDCNYAVAKIEGTEAPSEEEEESEAEDEPERVDPETGLPMGE